MNKDKFQDKYNQIFQELKEEKMDWNFDDFLAQTEEKSKEYKLIPLYKKFGKQWLCIAASMILAVGFVIILKNNFSENITVKSIETAQKEIKKNTENQYITNNQSIAKTSDNDFLLTKYANTKPIKRKKSRYKKTAQYLAKNHYSKYKHQRNIQIDDELELVKYNPDFVIINGKPVATEDEAIKYTKNAINMLGENINTALEKAEPVKLLTVNF